jgi:hypothetical protein
VLVLPPLLAFLLGNALLWYAAHRAGFDYFANESWSRSDSGHYLRIATRGYLISPCMGPLYPAGSWCGNTNWLPLYPWLMRLLSLTGLSLPAAGVLLSSAFHLASLALLWALLGARLTLSSLACLAIAAVFPGSVYFHAVFPVSMMVCLTLLFLLLLVRRRWAAAGVAAALAALTYAPGILLAPVAAIWMLITQPRRPLWPLLLRLAEVCALVAVGLLITLAVQRQQTGLWDAYFRDQAKYHAGYGNPLGTLADTLLKPATPDAAERRLPAVQRNLVNRMGIVKAQLVFVTVLLALGLGAVAVRRRASDIEVGALATAVMLWASPLAFGGAISLYRTMALLVPVVVPLRRLPAPVLLPLVVVAAYISYRMVPPFLQATFH